MPVYPERIGHDELLRQLATLWIDMGGGRRTVARKNLPPTAFDPSPNVVVIARKEEPHGDVLSSAYSSHLWQPAKPYQNLPHVPTAFPWQLTLPDGRRAFLFTWINWKRNSLSLFQSYLKDQSRQHGRITEAGIVEVENLQLALRDCGIMHFGEYAATHKPPARKPPSAAEVLKTSRTFLKGRKDALMEIDVREFEDEEAHNEEFVTRTIASFEKKFASRLKSLKAEYGEPADTGTDEHNDIPVNGVFRFALWRVGAKTLYLAASHEDVGLPCVLILGVGVKTPKLRRSRKR